MEGNMEKQKLARNFYRRHLLTKTFLAWKVYARIKMLKQLQVQQATWFYNSLLLTKTFVCWLNVAKHQRHMMRRKNKLALWLWSLSLQKKVFHAWYTVVFYQRAVFSLRSRRGHFGTKLKEDDRKTSSSIDEVPLITTVTRKTETLASGAEMGKVIRRKTKPKRPNFLTPNQLVQDKQIKNLNGNDRWLQSIDLTPASFENFVPTREHAYPLPLSDPSRNNKWMKANANVFSTNFCKKLLTEDNNYHTVLNQQCNSSRFTAIPTKFCSLPYEYVKLGLGNDGNHGIEQTDQAAMTNDVLLCPADFSFGLCFLTSGSKTMQNLDLRETYSCSNVLLPPNAFVDNHCLANCTPDSFCRQPVCTHSGAIVNKKIDDFLIPPKIFYQWLG